MSRIKKFFDENKYIFIMLGVAAVYAAALRFCFGITPSLVETFAVAFGIIEFDLLRREKSSGFAFAVIKCVLLAFWFITIGLYGQVAYRVAFAIFNFVALLIWLFPKRITNKKNLKPAWLPVKFGLAIYTAAILFGLVMLACFDAITAMDMIVAALAALGNLLIIFKKTDTWAIWLAADFIGLPLFFITGSWMYLLLTVFMMGIEFASLRSWGGKK
ncbi:MAG: nicotinamide riboside transporter PnuC [Rickettsiales bacterium]|jgi:nicotinamide mononucleotide transporter|nr:nicotinamide riboside transporter PnuC [Rickettsiales bacterium]